MSEESEYDRGIVALRELLNSGHGVQLAGLNEAETRTRFVDRLLFDVLLWDKYEGVEEERVTEEGTFFDYRLKGRGVSAIVEAKKSGICFEVPHGDKKTRTRAIRSLMSMDPKIKSAIEQAVGYALPYSIPFAVVCNGWQVIAVATQNKSGSHWADGKALVFYDLSDIESFFKVFWECLSPSGMREGGLRKLLTAQTESLPPPRPIEKIIGRNRTRRRNDLQGELATLGDLVFGGGDMFQDRPTFHKYCYCENGAVAQASAGSRAYLQSRYPELFESVAGTPPLTPVKTKQGIASALTNLTNFKKPVLLLGDVGVGKTTFIEHFFLVILHEKRNELLVIRMDLGARPSKVSDLPDATWARVRESLLDDYGIDVEDFEFLIPAYHSKISKAMRANLEKRRAEGGEAAYRSYLENYINAEMAKNLDTHIATVFSHLKRSHRKSVVLIFDNLDQRDSEMQKSGFLQSQISASSWDVYTMIALRPETLSKSHMGAEVNAYHHKAFTVSPPRFDELVGRRLEAASAMLRNEISLDESILHRSVAFRSDSCADFLSILKHSFSNNRQLANACESLSNGNMRLAQEYIVDFMGCGHVNSEKILRHWRTGDRRYVIPEHEFLRGIIFRDREYFEEDNGGSAIMNVYRVLGGDAREHFLVLSILSLVEGGNDGSYTETGRVESSLAEIDFSFRKIQWALGRCVAGGLCENEKKNSTNEGCEWLRLTPRGIYYLNELARKFVYNDAVCFDTPIKDSSVRASLIAGADIFQRLERVKKFIDYIYGVSRQYHEVLDVFEVEPWYQAILADVKRVTQSMERIGRGR